ncbi:MAG TPA: AAA family ATPase [Nakamurella sp.]
MTHVLAVANQKGGVAKTTTVHALGAAWSERGRRVLLVDLDPQACLTFSTGTDPDELPASLHEVLLGRAGIRDVVISCDGVDLVPASIDLAGAEVHLLTRPGREYGVRRALDQVRSGYDVILIDCPPSLGVLTINGLTAADRVLVPLQCETLSHRGVGQLLETVGDVRSFTNESLAVLGVVATMTTRAPGWPGRPWRRSARPTGWRCSSRRSRSRCGWRRRRGAAVRCSATRRGPGARMPTAPWPRRSMTFSPAVPDDP